jgi:hypothetical protein
MKKLVAAVVLCVSGVLLGAIAAWPAGQGTQTPASSIKTPAAPAQIAKLQNPEITKLQEQVALLIEQDRQKTAQLGQLKYQVGQLQTQLTELKTSLSYDYVPTAGPGNCTSRGYMNVASAQKSPFVLLYTWGNCKSQ